MRRLTRRQLLGAAGTAVAGGLAGCSHQPSDAWPQAGARVSRTGHNPQATGPTDGGRLAWTVQTNGQALSAPVVLAESAYLNSATAAALTTTAGTPVWEQPLPHTSGITPAAGSERLYVAARFALYAFDRSDGAQAWTYAQGRQVVNGVGVDGDQVYVGFRGTDAPFDATLSALDAATGTENWRREVGADNVLLFTPAVGAGLVAVGKESVYAHDAATGERRWTFDDPDAHFGTPAIHDGTIYVGATTTDRAGWVVALDAADGTEQWRVETDLGARSLAVADDTVYVTSDAVYAIDATDGSRRWRVGSNRFTRASPSVAGDTVYVSGVGGTLAALRRADGRERWRLSTGGFLLSAPAIVGSSAYAAARNGLAYRIDEA